MAKVHAEDYPTDFQEQMQGHKQEQEREPSPDPGEAEGDYEVGYGKPPKATQFKKGQSGNPKGRPKGSLNLRTILDMAANEKVQIMMNGTPRKLPKLQIAVTQVMNQATGGNLKAFREVINLYRLEVSSQASQEDEKAVEDPKQDKDVLHQLIARMKKQFGNGGSGSGMGETA